MVMQSFAAQYSVSLRGVRAINSCSLRKGAIEPSLRTYICCSPLGSKQLLGGPYWGGMDGSCLVVLKLRGSLPVVRRRELISRGIE